MPGGAILAGIVNGAQIIVLNEAYNIVARWLTVRMILYKTCEPELIDVFLGLGKPQDKHRVREPADCQNVLVPVL